MDHQTAIRNGPVGKKQPDLKKLLAESWYWYLTGKNREGIPSEYEYAMKRMRRSSGLLPGSPRCLECNLPMAGPFSWLMKSKPSSFNPRLCRVCEQAMRKEEAGAEVELSMLFADVRGSTTLAQTTSTSEFKALIQRFYQAATEVLVRNNAMVNRLMETSLPSSSLISMPQTCVVLPR